MSIAGSILLLALAAALANYAVDCSAVNTPEQAMQCCGSMPCPPHHGSSEDCCKSMPSMHAPFVQPAASAAHSTAIQVTANSHAPPAGSSSPPLPLRI